MSRPSVLVVAAAGTATVLYFFFRNRRRIQCSSENESQEELSLNHVNQSTTPAATDAPRKSISPSLGEKHTGAPQLSETSDMSVPGAKWARCRCCVARSPAKSMLEFIGAQGLEPGLSCYSRQVELAHMIDTHSHAHQELSLDVISGVQQILPSAAGLSSAAVMAVSEAEWTSVLAFTGHSGVTVDGGTDNNTNSGSVVGQARSGATVLVPGLGVHPWYVQEVSPGWLSRLRANLLAHPGAIVGEIGLCRCAKNLRGPGNKAKHWPLQLDTCSQQLELAAELRRPASVHCVQAHGGLATLLSTLLQSPSRTRAYEESKHSGVQTDAQASRNLLIDEATAPSFTNAMPKPEDTLRPAPVIPIWRRLPPAIALHSFSGSVGQVANFLALETAAVQHSTKHKEKNAAKSGSPATGEATPQNTTIYFGFSHTINVGSGQVASAALLATIRAVPDDRVLVESDEVGGGTPNDDGVLGRCAGAMARAVELVADAKGWTCEEAASRTSANAQRFLSSGHV